MPLYTITFENIAFVLNVEVLLCYLISNIYVFQLSGQEYLKLIKKENSYKIKINSYLLYKMIRIGEVRILFGW